MKRRDSDYYPSTPEVVEALRLWVASDLLPELPDSQPVYYEPAAGYGAIVRGLQVGGTTSQSQWATTEIQPDLVKLLRPHSTAVCGDAVALHQRFGCATPASRTIVIANPPFTDLDDFVSLALDFVEQGAWAIILSRGQWLDEAGQAELRKRRRPSHQLRMCWRASFDGKGSPSATHCWNVWRPEYDGRDGTDLQFLERPTLDARHQELVAAHREFQPGVIGQRLL